MSSKYRSYKFWLAILGAVLIIVQNIFKANGVVITDEVGFNIINAICGVLVFLGVIDKPKNNTENTENPENAENKDSTKNNSANTEKINKKTKNNSEKTNKADEINSNENSVNAKDFETDKNAKSKNTKVEEQPKT